MRQPGHAATCAVPHQCTSVTADKLAAGNNFQKFLVRASSVSGATWRLFVAFCQSSEPADRYVFWCLQCDDAKVLRRGLVLDAAGYELSRVQPPYEGKAVGVERMTHSTSWSAEHSIILSDDDVRLECGEAAGVLRLCGSLSNLSFSVSAHIGACREPDAAATNMAATGWLRIGEEEAYATQLKALRGGASDCLGAAGTWLYLPGAGRWVDVATERVGPVGRLDSTWQSGRTFETYQLDFDFEDQNFKLSVRALDRKQRGEVLIGQRPKWIGFCSILGTMDGHAVNETGLLMVSGRPDQSGFEELIQRANRSAVQACERILPASAELDTLFDEAEVGELDLAPLAIDGLSSMVQPIRSILARGGKGWRGYALALCCEAVGGDFSNFQDWLAFSEILHVGSLIVDDVEDGSVLRRGAAACHMTYGVPTAINSGCLAYFVVQRIIDRSEVNSRTRTRLYKEYLDLLRIAHVGQGLDLALGVQERMMEVLASGQTLNRLELEIRRAHRLKSGVPFRGFARMGAILGEGDAAEVDALGKFFLRIGTAFQLLDDVLNIEGFDGNLKLRGEDIARGKLTLPVVRAIQLMSDRERTDFVRDWARCENDSARICDITARVRKTGAIVECRSEIRAEQIASWTDLSASLANSTAKAILKMFSERILTTFY